MSTTTTWYFANGAKIEFGEGDCEPVVSGDPEGEYCVCIDDTVHWDEEMYAKVMSRLKEPGIGVAIHRAATGTGPVLIRTKS